MLSRALCAQRNRRWRPCGTPPPWPLVPMVCVVSSVWTGRSFGPPRILARLLTDVLISRPLIVATVSASATVRVCLEALSKRTRVEVICTEGRPLMGHSDPRPEEAAITAPMPTSVQTVVGMPAVTRRSGRSLRPL